ncbi:hypothetical protein M405DRAFT_869923 [Rhizopogon salebrosus TDB-379]|nr:hypothetical protein M405DRAFT_869922 [Rhizopogon salebrosus TDB-379]KAJ8579835.1 hypothetical protein M405DRAFT_869923 [Rhizopogon salebrosus TDB-379]
MSALEKLVGALFMIMGTDVGHPAPGLKNQPSVASLTAIPMDTMQHPNLLLTLAHKP